MVVMQVQQRALLAATVSTERTTNISFKILKSPSDTQSPYRYGTYDTAVGDTNNNFYDKKKISNNHKRNKSSRRSGSVKMGSSMLVIGFAVVKALIL